jgi:hypothetical protein
VMGVYSMMIMGMGPFGALLAGTVAERFGAPVAVIGGGIVCIIAGVLFALRLPMLRGEAVKLIIAQQAPSGEPPDQTTATGAEGR